MNAPLLLLIGMVVVVVGILVFKLHAFLALIGGAIVVAVLTPARSTFLTAVRAAAIDVQSIDTAGNLTLRAKPNQFADGATLTVVPSEPAPTRTSGKLRVSHEAGATLAKPLDGYLVRHGDLVIDPTKEAAARAEADKTPGERIAAGFGKTAEAVGILIAMASVVGATLLESGAAERVILAVRRALGDKRTPLAFVLGGFLLCIPCFFETVFYLMIPLGKVMRVRTGRDYTLYVLSIIAGAAMAHSLVPPTPGPLSIIDQLDVKIGHMMLGGTIVGIVAALAGYQYARWANLRWDLPLRDAGGLSVSELAEGSTRDERILPPLWLSLVPILMPIVLIGVGTGLKRSATTGPATHVLKVIGNQNVALSLAALVGLVMVALQCRPAGAPKPRAAIQHALNSSGAMILLISAGGAFGAVLRQTDIATSLREMMPSSRLWILPIAFATTTLIRLAQGSATVSMITVAGIFAPLALGGGHDLGYHPVYLALAIGCGSKPGMWMNDAGFWIMSRMSGFTEAETLKTASVMGVIMGIAGLIVVLLGAKLLPLM
jgi:GntP family gluconate:H+ symporter